RRHKSSILRKYKRNVVHVGVRRHQTRYVKRQLSRLSLRLANLPSPLSGDVPICGKVDLVSNGTTGRKEEHERGRRGRGERTSPHKRRVCEEGLYLIVATVILKDDWRVVVE